MAYFTSKSEMHDLCVWNDGIGHAFSLPLPSQGSVWQVVRDKLEDDMGAKDLSFSCPPTAYSARDRLDALPWDVFGTPKGARKTKREGGSEVWSLSPIDIDPGDFTAETLEKASRRVYRGWNEGHRFCKHIPIILGVSSRLVYASRVTKRVISSQAWCRSHWSLGQGYQYPPQREGP